MTKATDGVSNNPAHATTAIVNYTDWAALEREFILNRDHTKPIPWLREAMRWPENRIYNGNTRKRIEGWGAKRVQVQSKLTEAALAEVMEIERTRIPELHKAKLNLVAKIVKDVGNWHNLNAADKQLCYQILKVELGQPTNPNNIKPPATQDPVEALLVEYGLMRDGEIIDDTTIDDERLISGQDSRQVADADSSPPAEVSQPPVL